MSGVPPASTPEAPIRDDADNEVPRLVVIGCGALARELVALSRSIPGVRVLGVDALLHQHPERITAAVARRIAESRERWGPDIRIFVAYADCGTGGALDAVLAEHEVERLPGAHCYGFFAGNEVWQALHDVEPGTFYLTDFLARHFDALVWRGLGLDRYPELLPDIFGNYTRLLYLAQSDDADLDARAEAAAKRLGLAYERRRTGYGELQPALERFVAGLDLAPSPASSGADRT